MNTIPPSRKAYPTGVSDEERALVAEDALQRRYALREVFNALCWIVRAGALWRLLDSLPTNFPPWAAVYQQTRRWVVERSFAWLARFRRLTRDCERLPTVLAGVHFIAFACLALHRVVPTILSS